MKFPLICALLIAPIPAVADEDTRFRRVDAHINHALAASTVQWSVRYQENSRMIGCTSCDTDAFISIALAPFPAKANSAEDVFDSYLVGRSETCAALSSGVFTGCVFTKQTHHRFMPGYHALTRLEDDRVSYERIMISNGMIFVYGEGPDTPSFIAALEEMGSTMTHAINQMY